MSPSTRLRITHCCAGAWLEALMLHACSGGTVGYDAMGAPLIGSTIPLALATNSPIPIASLVRPVFWKRLESSVQRTKFRPFRSAI